MYKPKAAAGPRGGSILSTLQATSMLESRPILPAEILAEILDRLPVSDLFRCARASMRLRDMVYDDTRWVARLMSMGCWDDVEARQRFEDAMRRRREAQAAERANGAAPAPAPGAAGQRSASTMLFDASIEEERRKQRPVTAARIDGFETLTLGPAPASAAAKDPAQDTAALLDVLRNVKSVRGYARFEYGKVYRALAPFYLDLIRARSHADPIIFKVFRDPERQAQMLANLTTFSKSDWSQGWHEREQKVLTMRGIFEGAALREFEQGYKFWDVDGRMKRYANVLYLLKSSSAGVDIFVQKHPIFEDREVIAESRDCLNQAPYGEITLEPSRYFFETLSRKVNEQVATIERIFPEPGEVFWALVDKIREDIISDYASVLFEEAHNRGLGGSLEPYLKAVSGVFEQCLLFFQTLNVPKGGSRESNAAKVKEMLLKIFEGHIFIYLEDELAFFTKHAKTEVENWDKQLSEQDATAESFYMGSFNRQADKKDFLSSFKKVVMMPVTVLPSLPIGSAFGGTSKPAAGPNGAASQQASTSTPNQSRPHTPGPGLGLGGGGGGEGRRSPLPDKAPTDELAAKAALMTSRLEGIKSLFSIEVALNLVHAAKTSLGRAAVFITLGGQAGEEAREQCAKVFVELLRFLGTAHVKAGFDRAIDHLSQYNPREAGAPHDAGAGVAPLVTFIELVNVGDLISQMVDVFYEQQLAAPRIADRNDFLDPAGLAKKKFEQMLDESVAAGLNRGIDALMDEVEFLFATTQPPTDYCPPDDDPVADPGPTATARRVVDLVSAHTRMLVGSTDKSVLDVFNGEVGLRLFTAVCKHLKRQRVSVSGAVRLIADSGLLFEWARGLRNPDLLAYFRALRELSQVFLIDARSHAREMAAVIADADRFGGVFRAEEVYEFAQRRADWYAVKKDVERAMYGLECGIM